MLRKTLTALAIVGASCSAYADAEIAQTEQSSEMISVVEVGFGTGGDVTQFFVSGEHVLNDQYIVGASIDFADIDVPFGSQSLNGFRVDALRTHSINETSEVVYGAYAGLGWYEFDVFGFKYDDDSFLYGVTAEYRQHFNEKVDFAARATFASAYSNTEILFGAEAQYAVSDVMKVALSFDTGSYIGHTETLFGIKGQYRF